MITDPLIVRRRLIWIGIGVAALLLVLIVEVVLTGPTRGAVRAYSALLAAANRPVPDLEEARRLCTDRYLRTHTLVPADEGGLVGLPRNIHQNFQVWREGPDVLLCPTNRVGPVYRFVQAPDGWKFDGPIGLLMPGGQVVPMPEIDDARD